MKKLIAKYPIKIGNILVPKGTEGIMASLEEMQKIFPNIKYSSKSNQIGAKFFDLDPCVVHKSQVLFLT
jgi:hypothetical protein